jgi:hypothetical protein
MKCPNWWAHQGIVPGDSAGFQVSLNSRIGHYGLIQPIFNLPIRQHTSQFTNLNLRLTYKKISLFTL